MHLSFSLAAVALLGTASALPGDYGHARKSGDSYAWGTGSVSSSASSSLLTAPTGTGSTTVSVSKPTGTGMSSSSSSVPIGSGSYKPHSSSSYPHGSGSVSPPLTKTVEVYTTTTVCPITTTEWEDNTSTIKTILTTSTLTMTSCAGGCHGTGATSTATRVAYPSGGKPHESGSGSVQTPVTKTTKTTDTTTTWATGTAIETITTVYPTTIASTITSFVPCSTPVFSESATTYFSTWLTVSYRTTTYETTITSSYTLYPSPTASATAITTANHGGSETSVSGTSIDATTTATTVWGEASGTCAPAETIYSTIVSYVTIYNGDKPSATATPLSPGSSFTWSHSSRPVKSTGYASPSGAKPTGH